MTYTPTPRRRFLRTLAAAAVGAPVLARVEGASAAVARAADGVSARPLDAPGVARLRAEYLLDPGLVYLNHASIGTVPRPVHQAHADYLELCESHPSLYVWGEPWRVAAEEARAAAARLLGAAPDDLAITHNTTEGFNVLAHGLPLGTGDEVLFSALNHPGASVPWERMAPRRGFSVRSFDLPLERVPAMTADEIVALHLAAVSPRTRALVVPHVDNVVGMRLPLRRLAAAARAAGVRWILVDGAQSAGMVPVALDEAGVDAYAMSPHKWLQAPKGLGLFWTSPGLRPDLPPMWHRTGGEGRGPSARQYEDYSTRAWPAVVALGDALAFHAGVAPAAREARLRAVRARIRERVDAEVALGWASPEAWGLGSAIVAVAVGPRAPELGRILMERHRVDVRAFGGPSGTLRFSPNLATTDAEVDRALDALTGELG